MESRLTVLASGSSGNAALLEHDGFGLLIDCGIGPRVLADRLAAVGRSWKAVHTVLVTHTHGDHWNPLTLGQLRRQNIPLVAHPRHHDGMGTREEHDALCRAGLTREYAADKWFDVTPSLACRPVRVPHDSDPTFAFRFEARDGGTGWALGFASDVGHVTPELASAFDGVDALAVEYNHDVQLQKASGRPKILVDRVLGDLGHLSNVQAGDFTRRVARAAGTDRLAFVVQLHLSRECNKPELADHEGRLALADDAPTALLVTAMQGAPTATLPLEARSRSLRAARPAPPGVRSFQPTLPGFDGQRREGA